MKLPRSERLIREAEGDDAGRWRQRLENERPVVVVQMTMNEVYAAVTERRGEDRDVVGVGEGRLNLLIELARRDGGKIRRMQPEIADVVELDVAVPAFRPRAGGEGSLLLCDEAGARIDGDVEGLPVR